MFTFNRGFGALLIGLMSIGTAASSVSTSSPTTRSFQATEIHRAPDSLQIWDSSPNVTRKEYLPHGISAAVEVPPKPITLPPSPRMMPRASRTRRAMPTIRHSSPSSAQYAYYARPHEIYYTSNCPAGPAWVMNLAHQITAERFGESQWPSQRRLILRESNGNPWCMNSAGAYGVGQALPGSKMGGNWRYDVRHQIEWMCGYEAGRYGNPDGALAHSNSHNWY